MTPTERAGWVLLAERIVQYGVTQEDSMSGYVLSVEGNGSITTIQREIVEGLARAVVSLATAQDEEIR